VTGCLLDTNVVLIALAEPEKLTSAVRSAVLRGPNIVSAVTFWEVTLKASRGKLDVGDPRVWWATALADLGATPLPLRPEHVAELQSVPQLHNDPFDRALIAQAICEELALVTTDGELPRYASERLRVIR
jgi:PIN domain nuclease of toxin-antitoxin system